jgi:hypothetical protein
MRITKTATAANNSGSVKPLYDDPSMPSVAVGYTCFYNQNIRPACVG